MKHNLIKVLVTISLSVASLVTAQAQSLQIKQGGNPVIGHYCMPVDDTGTPFTVEGINLNSDTSVTATIVSTTWSVAGGIQKVSESGSSVSVAPLTGTTYATQYSKYAKGKLRVACHVEYSYDYIISDCDGYTRTDTFTYYKDYSSTVEIFKEFSSLADNAIVGPECVLPGDSITYSVAPWVSLYQMNQVGFDSYNWTIPQGLNAGDLYFSADSSSVTFTAGTDIAGKTLSVNMGKCNTAQTPLTFTLGQEPADPIFEGKDLNSYCLPFGTQVDTIIISNPQPGTTYEWDMRSWSVIDTSQNGDTVIYKPLNNSQTIILKMSGGCSDKQFVYDINRSITPTDSIMTDYGYCIPANADLTFYLKNVPDGTEMEWTILSGTDWSIADDQKNKACPTIHVGTGTGVLSAKTSNCTNNSVVFTFNIKPEQPGIITGETCLQSGATSALNYSITPVLNADSYQWIYPNGWTVNGTDSVSASISLIPNGTNGGDIQVRAIGCSPSDWSVLEVELAGVAPDSITTTTCINAGFADQVNYSVYFNGTAPVDQTYSWSIPATFGVITSANADSSSVSIATTGREGIHPLKVRAVTGCGYTDWNSTDVTITKESFTISESIIVPGVLSSYYTYPSLDWVNNHDFEWIYNGKSIKSSNKYVTNNTDPGLLTLSDSSFYVTVVNQTTGCATRKYSTSTGMRSPKALAPENKSATLNTEDLSATLSLYPNPTSSELTINMSSAGNINIWIVSTSGSVLKTIINQPSITTVNVSDLTTGIYSVVVYQRDSRYSKQLFINK